MERSHTPLNVWFWAAYLVASQTPGMSAVQFQRQLGLSRYETAFQILHKLRSGMVRPNQDRIGGQPKNHVEVDETWVGGRTRGEGRGVHHKRLKRRIASDPRLVGVKRRGTGEEEQWLWSGDEVDVYFKGAAVAVEVKAGNAARGELHRGVFQCIKYKAVIEAQQISEGEVPTADCRLAIGGRLPDDLRGLCERLGVEYFDELDDE